MAAVDLSDYTLGELKGLLFDVEQAIKARRREELDGAHARIAEIARGAGIPIDKLLNGTKRRS
jgi:DNA-binding protein H-NS